MKKLSLASLIAAALALAGCQSSRLPAYQTSRDTLFRLQQLDAPAVSVGAFTGDEPSLGSCSFWTDEEGEQSYLGYMRGALVDELGAAGLHSDVAGGIVITGAVERLSLSTRMSPFERRWSIGLLLTSSNGRQMRVEHELVFDGVAVGGPTTCRRAALFFAPAVRGLFEKAVTSPEFAALLD